MTGGRIKQTLSKAARDALKMNGDASHLSADLLTMTEVDRAHLVMLVHTGLIRKNDAAQILREIDRLRAEDFHSLLKIEAPRGTYLMYENHLISTLGADIGGSLHVARSRNDLNATTVRLALREPIKNLLRELFKLNISLIFRAKKYADVFLPMYTHYQMAQPSSMGHYFTAVSTGIERSIESVLYILQSNMDECPLGAGAISGTSLPIDSSITSRLLGFSHPTSNSIDAIASRDFVARLLSEVAILGVLLSRVSADLQLWTTDEFGFFALPDSLIGSSSIMPQKRNPYLLEHIQGRSTKPLGVFVSALTAMHAKPLTNNISANTEAVSGVMLAFAEITSSVILLRLLVRGLQPKSDGLLKRIGSSFLEATEIANRISMGGTAFRSAHEMVGDAITSLLQSDPGSRSETLVNHLLRQGVNFDSDNLDEISLSRGSRYGGGPGGEVVRQNIGLRLNALKRQITRCNEFTGRWIKAKTDLDFAVADVAFE